MTARELEAVMGQPSEVVSDTYGELEIPSKIYRYQNAGALGQAEFTLARGIIVKLVCLNMDGFSCPDRCRILERLGVKKWALCIKGTDTPHALSFKQPSKKVDEIWLTLFDGDTFKSITVTYTAGK